MSDDYILASPDPSLPNSRTLDDGLGINLVDTGPQGTVTINTVGNLNAIAQMNSAGIPTLNGDGTGQIRSIVASSTTSVTNGTGAAGNIQINVTPGTSLQNVQVYQSGSLVPGVPAAPNLNLIAGTGMNITVQQGVAGGASTDITFQSTGGGGGGGGAPDDAFYVVTKSDSTLTNEVNLGGLSNGILMSTVSGGTATITPTSSIFTDAQNLFIGTTTLPAGITIADRNILITTTGGSGENITTGRFNIGIGPGVYNALTTGSDNVHVGNNAGLTLTTGNQNVGVGSGANQNVVTGSNNTSYGYLAGYNYDYNEGTFIGAEADASQTGLTNVTAIGYNAKVNTDNTLVLGQPGTSVVIGGNTAPAGNYALNLVTGSDTSLFIASGSAPTAPLIAGGVFYVDSNSNPQYLSDPVGQSGQIVTSITPILTGSLLVGNATDSLYDQLPLGTSGQVLTSNGSTAIWANAAADSIRVFSPVTMTPIAGSPVAPGAFDGIWQINSASNAGLLQLFTGALARLSPSSRLIINISVAIPLNNVPTGNIQLGLTTNVAPGTFNNHATFQINGASVMTAATGGGTVYMASGTMIIDPTSLINPAVTNIFINVQNNTGASNILLPDFSGCTQITVQEVANYVV